jgi:hypothetical protein
VRSQFGGDAPVPATFRAHSIERFNKQGGSDSEFRLRWVGRAGRQIVTGPADPVMANVIETFATAASPKPISQVRNINDELVFRTVYPSLAREQSCVTCHNALQPDKPAWQLNDVMGAFAIDIPIGPFLRTIQREAFLLALAMFVILAAVGLAFFILHFRQISQREAAERTLGRRVEERTAELRAAQDELGARARTADVTGRAQHRALRPDHFRPVGLHAQP